jgi:hypothetical protein
MEQFFTLIALNNARARAGTIQTARGIPRDRARDTQQGRWARRQGEGRALHPRAGYAKTSVRPVHNDPNYQ